MRSVCRSSHHERSPGTDASTSRFPAVGFVSGVLAALSFLASRKSSGGVRIGLALVGAIFVLLPGYLLVALFAPGVIDARILVYQAFFEDLKPGMTRSEVLAILEKHYLADVPPQYAKIMRDSAGPRMNRAFS